MAEKEEKQDRHPRPSLVWPVVLITAGVLFLLSNMGVLDIDFWNLWRLWPVLLILAGLEIILGRRSALGNIIVLALTILVIAGVVVLLVSAPEIVGGSRSRANMRIDESREGLERLNLEIGFAAGRLELGKLTDSSSLVKGDLDLVTQRRPVWNMDRDDGRASLKYEGGGFSTSLNQGDRWNLRLSPKVGLSLQVDVGAGDGLVDLTGLDIRDLTVETGVGQSSITLPEKGDFGARVTGGVGNLVVKIPDGMAARLRVDRGIGSLDISDRFEEQGDDLYLTADWESNENRVDLEIEVGIGMVRVREP